MKKSIAVILIILLLGLTLPACDTTDTKKIFMTGYKKVAAGIDCAIALKEDGTVWKIQVFNNTNPKKIADNMKDIASGGYVTFLIKSDDTLWAFGENTHGEFAELSIEKTDTPVKIMDNIRYVACGDYKVVATKTDGSVWSWGGNKYYNLGEKKNSPVKISDNAVMALPGFIDTYVIDKNEDLFAIHNSDCNLPEVTRTGKKKIADNVKYVNGNYMVKNDGSLYSFTIDNNWKADFKLIMKNVRFIDGTCAIKEDGSLWAWNVRNPNVREVPRGGNPYPEKIMDKISYVTCLSSGAIVVRDDGSLCAWGSYSPRSFYSIPTLVQDNVKQAAGNYVLRGDRSVWEVTSSWNIKSTNKIAENIEKITDDGLLMRKNGSFWSVNYGEDGKASLKPVNNEAINAKYPGDLYMKPDGTAWLLRTDPANGNQIDIQVGKSISGIKDILPIDSSMGLFVALKNDGTLWFWYEDIKGNTVQPAIVKYKTPIKIAADIKEISPYNGGNTNIYFLAITNGKSMLAWRINPENLQQSNLNPTSIMDGAIEFKQIDQTPLPKSAFLKSDGSLWYFTAGEYDFKRTNGDFKRSLLDSAVKYADKFSEIRDCKLSYMIKNNSELWIKGFTNGIENNGENIYIRKTNVPKMEKVLDNVKTAKLDDNNCGYAICNDGSLWIIGYFNWDNKDKLNFDDIKPRKVLENVKSADFAFGSFLIQTEDNSLYTLGRNTVGECGVDFVGPVQNPHKLMDNVTWYDVNTLSALLKDGTYWRWGGVTGTSISSPIIEMPVMLDLYEHTPVITHLNYPSMIVGKAMHILVKVSDPAFTTKVELKRGKDKIPMRKCSNDNYFEATMGTEDTPGTLKYTICAYDSKGNSVETEEYETQVIADEKAEGIGLESY